MSDFRKVGAAFRDLNLWQVAADGMLVGASGELAFMYDIIPQEDVTLLAEAGCQAHVRAVRGVLEALPAGAALTFIVRSSRSVSPYAEILKSRIAENGPALKELIRSRLSVLGGGERRVRMLAALSVRREDSLRPRFLGLAIPSRMDARAVRRDLGRLKATLANLDGLLIGQLANAQVASRRLGRREVLDFYWSRFNPSRSRTGLKAPEPKSWLSLRCQLAASPAVEEETSLRIGGVGHRVFSLYTLGEQVELGATDAFLAGLPEGSTAVFHFMALDEAGALDRLKAQAKRSLGLTFLQGTKNYEATAKAQELDEIITLVRSKGERLYGFSVLVVASDADPASLTEKSLEVETLIRDRLGAEALPEDLMHGKMFAASFPLGAPLSVRRHTLTGEASACLAPLSAPWFGSPPGGAGGALLAGREGETVALDLFEGGSPRHGIVMGSTGSGKSFAMNHLVAGQMALDPGCRFVIVDVGGSYRRLCEITGGSYFDLAISKDSAINPLPPPGDVLGDDGRLDGDALGYLALLVEKMAGGPVSQSQRRIIESCLGELYSGAGKEAPFLGGLVKLLEVAGGDELDAQEARRLARDLRLFTQGTYGGILNAPSGMEYLKNRLSVFDLARLKEHPRLQGILIFIIGFSLTRKLAERHTRKVVILDEAWEFFNDPAASELVSRLYRTARKHNAVIVSVSQSPADFLKSLASDAILANSFWKLFLRLDMGHEELARFGLNPRQVEAAAALAMKKRAYSEAFVSFGTRSRTLRIQPTSFEYWIATTNAEDCAREAELMQSGTYQDRLAVIRHLAKKEPVRAP